MAFEVHSKTKSFFICIFGVAFVLDIIQLIGACVGAGGTQISSAVGGLLIDGLMLTAVLKQWRVFLKICRIIIIIVIVLKFVFIVLAIIALVALRKEKDADSDRKWLIVDMVALILSTLISSIFAFLLGKYIDQLEGR